jgi:serine protease Do
LRLPVILLQLLLGLIISTPIKAADFNPRKIYSETSKAVVLITAVEPGQRKGSKGTGSIISSKGFILTNAHVIINKKKGRPFSKLRVFLKPDRISGDLKKDTSIKYRAELVRFSEDLDLALLRIKSSSLGSLSPFLKFSDSSLVSIGDPVIAIGHPEQGGLWTLTTGTISSQINNYGNIPGKNVFQTEASINRGNSGGPLINSQGDIVGVNSIISRKAKDGMAITGINFSIKSRVAVNWLDSIGLKFELVSNRISTVSKPTKTYNAGIVVVPTEKPRTTPKPEAKPPSPPKPNKRSAKKPEILTKIRPYKEKDLLRQIEDEMEDMMDEMKKNFN